MYKKYSIALGLAFAPACIFSMESSSASSGSKRSWSPSIPAPAPEVCHLFATPNDDITKKIIDDINATTPSGYIGIESPSLTNEAIIQALERAIKRNVKVRIFTDTPSSRLSMAGARIFVRADLHAKRVVIAKAIPITAHEPGIIYIGSLNLSNNGPYNHEIMMRCTDHAIFIESYGDQQRELITRSIKPVQVGTRRIMPSRSPQACEARNEMITSFAACIHPNDYLYIATYTIDDQETVQALISAQKRATRPITIIVDGENWKKDKPALKQLVDAGLTVYIFNKDENKKTRLNYPMTAHIKAILRNCNQTCTAMISTANFTTKGMTDINYDLWEPCSLGFSARLKRILDTIIHESEKLEPYMFAIPLSDNPDENGKALLKLLEHPWEIAQNKANILRLIAQGANVHLKDAKYGETALIKSVNDQDIFRALIDAHADVNARTPEFGAAILTAAWSSRIEIVEDLIAAHADLNVSDQSGNTALFIAIGRNIPMAKMLLNAGADPNIPGAHRTIGYGRWKRSGATPPIMAAIATDDIELIQMLLEKGADPRAKSCEGKNAFDAAAGKPPILEMLQKAVAQKR